tara:strand:- start:1448 stop:1816 length:369 start_codon:yes stop_codon:yes gene_type:complete
MTDFLCYEELITISQEVGGLDKIHEYILSQKQVLGDSRIISKHLKEENDTLKDEREMNLVSIKKLKIEKEMLVKLSKDKLSEKKEQIEKLKVSLTKVDELVSSVLYGEGSHRCWDDGSFQKK